MPADRSRTSSTGLDEDTTLRQPKSGANQIGARELQRIELVASRLQNVRNRFEYES